MKNLFLWASAHEPTDTQLAELNDMGSVVFLKEVHPSLHKTLCNIQLDTDLIRLASKLCRFAYDEFCPAEQDADNWVFVHIVQPAGSPAFHVTLGQILNSDYAPWCVSELGTLFSYTQRISEDIPQPDGSVKKISVFKHEGWV